MGKLGGWVGFWVYFVVYFIVCFKFGGCMVWVFLGVFIYVEYVLVLCDYLVCYFIWVVVFIVYDWFFFIEGIDEEMVVFLVDGYLLDLIVFGSL